MIATDKEDYSQQQGMVAHARKDLAEALASLSFAAKAANRDLSRAKGNPDMTPVHEAWARVRDCEEGAYMAGLDLATAMGEDA